MQRSLTPFLAGCVAALLFAAPTPALAISAVAPAITSTGPGAIGTIGGTGITAIGITAIGTTDTGTAATATGTAIGPMAIMAAIGLTAIMGVMAIPIGARVSASGSVSNEPPEGSLSARGLIPLTQGLVKEAA